MTCNPASPAVIIQEIMANPGLDVERKRLFKEKKGKPWLERDKPVVKKEIGKGRGKPVVKGQTKEPTGTTTHLQLKQH